MTGFEATHLTLTRSFRFGPLLAEQADPWLEFTDAFIAAVDALTDESQADVTVSTTHKAKGREWPKVKVADDFPPPPDTGQLDDRDRPIPELVNVTYARLAYVAVHARSPSPRPRRALVD
jgi:superfamily I DNA/RNA helicase